MELYQVSIYFPVLVAKRTMFDLTLTVGPKSNLTSPFDSSYTFLIAMIYTFRYGTPGATGHVGLTFELKCNLHNLILHNGLPVYGDIITLGMPTSSRYTAHGQIGPLYDPRSN